MSMDLAEFEEAYRVTRYWVNAEGIWLGLSIGTPDPLLDKLLTARRKQRWACITAWNPGSVPRARAENLADQERLEERLRRAGHDLWVGQSVGPRLAGGEQWTEVCVFVPGMERAAAVELGREFGQLAIVHGERGGAPELVWC